MSERFESHGVLLKPSPQWAFDLYGFTDNHIGDCISDMMGEACLDPSFIEWIPICGELLDAGKRWPDSFNNPRIAKTKLRYGWSKMVHWFGMLPVLFASDEERAAWLKHVKPRLYRTQHGMTRDPYTFFMAAVVINGYSPTAWFGDMRMPFFQRRWGISQWRKYLLTGKEKHLKHYERATLRSMWMPRRVFAWELTYVRALAAGSEKILKALVKYKPLPNKGQS